MVLMIVISLTVLGFAQISRRNQREALDRQLSTQAFYAAETGVNDVRQIIRARADAGSAVPNKTTCSDTGGGVYSLTPNLDTGTVVKYTCVTVDASPNILRYNDVGTTSIIVPATSASGSPFDDLTFEWRTKVPGSPPAGCPTGLGFPPASSWSCDYGVLRIDLVPIGPGAFTSDSLRDATMTTFAVPVSSGGTNAISYQPSTANPNNATAVRCTATSCRLTINSLTSSSYYMRISSLYRSVKLEISGTNAAGSQLEISGAQAVIDSTGKAQDVLRRIQVNVPLRSTSQNELSDFAIQSTDSICKQFSVMSGGYASSTASAPGDSRLCSPFTVTP